MKNIKPKYLSTDDNNQITCQNLTHSTGPKSVSVTRPPLHTFSQYSDLLKPHRDGLLISACNILGFFKTESQVHSPLPCKSVPKAY